MSDLRSSRLRGAFSSSSPSRRSPIHSSKIKAKDAKPFRLFDLPRELRDRVYRAALVVPLIDVELVSCASDDDDEETVAMHPQPKLRTTYTSLGKTMTYRLAKPRGCSCGECVKDPVPQVQLFYVNRRIYEECREIFYKENDFNMVLASGLGCKSFLKDREYAVPMIRKLSFEVPLHTADFSYARWSDKHYKDLFHIIKQKSGIRQLTLNIHGLVPDVTTNEKKFRCTCDCASWEHPLLGLGNLLGLEGIPHSRTNKLHNNEWKLLKSLASTITGLSRLRINIEFCYHMLDHEGHEDDIFEHEHIRGFIGYLRSKMLKKGDSLGTVNIHGFCRLQDEIEDKRYRFHSDDDEYGKSYLKKTNGAAHQASRHHHSDSGSEIDHDDDSNLSDLEDVSDEWEDEDNVSDQGSDDDDEHDDTDTDMPELENDRNGGAQLPPIEDVD